MAKKPYSIATRWVLSTVIHHRMVSPNDKRSSNKRRNLFY